MNSSNIFAKAHHLLEANEARRISQSDMAKRLGISVRAYSLYVHGQETIAFKSFVQMMRMLTKEQLVTLLHDSQHIGNNDGKE